MKSPTQKLKQSCWPFSVATMLEQTAAHMDTGMVVLGIATSNSKLKAISRSA